MNKNPGQKLYEDKIQELYDELKSLFSQLLSSMSSEEKDKKKSATSNFLSSCEELQRLLPTNQQPQWLSQLISESSIFLNYPDKPNSNDRLLRVLMQHNYAIHAHDWHFDSYDLENYNFDLIYDEIKDQSNISQKFHSLIDSLKGIIESGEVDKIVVKEALLQLISVIEQNKDGSFLSVKGVTEFVFRFMKNSIWGALKKISELKIFIEAFEKSAKEMGLESDKILKEVKNKFNRNYVKSIKNNTHNDIKFLEHFPSDIDEKKALTYKPKDN